MAYTYLEFEKPISDLENKIESLRDNKENDESVHQEISSISDRIENLTKEIYEGLSIWQKVKVAAEIENFRFHDLRACAITNFMLPPFNFTIAQTAVISGHKSWDELKRYERIKAEQLVDTFKRLKK